MTGLSPTGAARRGTTNWLEPNRPQDVMDYQLGTETWQETESKPQPGQRRTPKPGRRERTRRAGEKCRLPPAAAGVGVDVAGRASLAQRGG